MATPTAPIITLQSYSRTYVGIDTWRTAIKAAEVVDKPQREKIYKVYKEIELDAQLTTCVEKRQLNIINGRIRFFNEDGSENEEINKLIDCEAFEEILKEIINSRFWGHSLLWFNNISLEEGIDHVLINRMHVKPELGIVCNKPSDTTGESYTEDPTAQYCLAVGASHDLGLFNKAAQWVIYKKGCVSDHALFAEQFGSPFREFIYKDPAAKPPLLAAAKQSTSAQYIVRPENADFKIHESQQKSGSNDLFGGFEKTCDQQITKLILHNTMTTDAEGGNYKGEVHQTSEAGVLGADRRFVLRTLNEKFTKMLNVFGLNVTGKFEYEEIDTMSLSDRLEIDIKLSEKIAIAPEYWYEKYKIPVPESGAAAANTNNTETDDQEENADLSARGIGRASQKDQTLLRKFISLFSTQP